MDRKPGEFVKFVAAIIAERWIKKNRPVKTDSDKSKKTTKCNDSEGHQ